MADRRRWLFGPLIAAGLAGCGVPLGGLDKKGTTAVQTTDQASVSSVGQNAFQPNLQSVPLLSTGEQETPPDPIDPVDGRGAAGVTRLDEPFELDLEGGTAVQLVVGAPLRADLVATFPLGGRPQRVDGDPLSPDLSVESFVVSTDVATTLRILPEEFRQEPLSGLVRWYAWLLPSSRGGVTSPEPSAGPAGTIALPGEFSFEALESGERLEVLVVGPTGSDLVLHVRVGSDVYRIDNDPQAPDRTTEGFTIEVDDPAVADVEVANFDGGVLPGDVRWAVIRLPLEDSLRHKAD